MNRVIVIGGGASGLMAAYTAAKNGAQVTLIEKNEKLGKKIYITGKGRCNLTNDCTPDEFLQHVVNGSKFLSCAIWSFSPHNLMEFMENYGLQLKTERGNRVFPLSDHASDVTKTLENACKEVGVCLKLNEQILKIGDLHCNMRDIVSSKQAYQCEKVIVATGGLSYPSTGSTGDGLQFAKAFCHHIVDCVPSLVGIECKGNFSALQGISLKNVCLTVRSDKIIFSQIGELLFTHYGISGPLTLSLSALVNRRDLRSLAAFIDLKPALDEATLNQRLIRDFSERKNEQMKNVMRGLLPAGLCIPVLEIAKIDCKKQANAVTKEERMRLIAALKQFPIQLSALRGFEEAVVTSGGISLKEINPRTMESKLEHGVYFCGELLDVDAFTGGFNLQIAFSTGYLAGKSAALCEISQ